VVRGGAGGEISLTSYCSLEEAGGTEPLLAGSLGRGLSLALARVVLLRFGRPGSQQV
jgi:hypothetical protein